MEVEESETDGGPSDSSIPPGFTPVRPRGRPRKRKKSVGNQSASSESQAESVKKAPRNTLQSSNPANRSPRNTRITTPTQKNGHPKSNDTVTYKLLYFINTTQIKTRIEMSHEWSKVAPLCRDIILQTAKGFLLKTNTPEEKVLHLLNKLKQQKIIDSFTETAARNNERSRAPPPETFAAVITGVDYEIEDVTVSQALADNNITHRYCKRIISRATSNPTTLIRVITGNAVAFHKLMNEGIFLLNKHFRASPSSPPPPLPQQCAKCTQFTHPTNRCPNVTRCSKCDGEHRTEKCTTNLPIKCTSCNTTDHVAWSIKCPNRPKKPLEGIPNTQIKSLNKKSRNVEDKLTKNSRIHAPTTIHDTIVNTYTRKINKPTNTNRIELIQKLKTRFINEYNIETTVIFSGNWIYILMVDLENPEEPSPTQPITPARCVITNNGG